MDATGEAGMAMFTSETPKAFRKIANHGVGNEDGGQV
jgi:hypothetical protein